jgi:hypothetical protein
LAQTPDVEMQMRAGRPPGVADGRDMLTSPDSLPDNDAYRTLFEVSVYRLSAIVMEDDYLVVVTIVHRWIGATAIRRAIFRVDHLSVSRSNNAFADRPRDIDRILHSLYRKVRDFPGSGTRGLGDSEPLPLHGEAHLICRVILKALREPRVGMLTADLHSATGIARRHVSTPIIRTDDERHRHPFEARRHLPDEKITPRLGTCDTQLEPAARTLVNPRNQEWALRFKVERRATSCMFGLFGRLKNEDGRTDCQCDR